MKDADRIQNRGRRHPKGAYGRSINNAFQNYTLENVRYITEEEGK